MVYLYQFRTEEIAEQAADYIWHQKGVDSTNIAQIREFVAFQSTPEIAAAIATQFRIEILNMD